MDTPGRCAVYWANMAERDQRSAALEAARANHPDGGGNHPDIRYALNMLNYAQMRQTEHLQNCPTCQAWLADLDRRSKPFEAE